MWGVFGGPAAVYLAVFLALLKWLPSGPEEPSKGLSRPFDVTVQLWPVSAISQQFLRDRDARFYLRHEDQQVAFDNFLATKDYLEQTKSVEETLRDKLVQVRIAPLGKYRLESDSMFLSGLIQLQVSSPGGESGHISERIGPNGEKLLVTTRVPLATGISSIKGSLSSGQALTNWVGGRPYLLTLEAKGITPRSRIELVDAKGALVPGAWAGNELGATNGKPIEVSADGSYLRVYAGVLTRTAGKGLRVRVTNPGGTVFSLSVAVVEQPTAHPKPISRE